jgi:hypothetical protein
MRLDETSVYAVRRRREIIALVQRVEPAKGLSHHGHKAAKVVERNSLRPRLATHGESDIDVAARIRVRVVI